MVEDDYESNRKAYNSLAEKWSKKYCKADVKRLMKVFVRYLKPKSRILDVGCGPGRDTKELARRGFDVIGMDFSEEMLRIAKAYFPEGNFIWMDMRDLTFPDNYFDGAWVMASFLNIKKIDAQRVLIGFKRVLNNGGVLAMAVKKGAGEIHENEDGETRLFSLYSEAELEDLLEMAGFHVIECFTEEAKPNTWIDVVSRVSK